jgi:CheY-like chemotaxis protein/KaiC/GvpD/RAD55 family RecA-like ATPase
METQSGNTIVSGIEPVDELMGGLDRGQLYLVHGEAAGKSLFGIKFLIEGLKQGENGALVIRYSPEDAVRRFARLGYDCLEDVYSGRLVILEYSDEIVQKIGKLRQLTPVLRELEWLLGETRPQRLVFDPLTSVLSGVEGNLEAPAREFAEWAGSFGATVVLVAKDSNREIIRCFEPLVAESFRFYVREAGDHAARFIAFEKSTGIADQAIEVDPSRGVFLLGRLYGSAEDAPQAAPQPPSTAELASIREELRSARDRIEEKGLELLDLTGDDSGQTIPSQRSPDTEELNSDQKRTNNLQTGKLTPAEEMAFLAPREKVNPPPPESISTEELDLRFEDDIEPARAGQGIEVPLDELSNLLDDLMGTTSPLELDLAGLEFLNDEAPQSSIDSSGNTAQSMKDPEVGSQEAQPSIPDDIGEMAPLERDPDPAKMHQAKHGRASDLRIDSAMAARTAELLLSPPESGAEFSVPSSLTQPRAVREPRQPEALGEAEVHAKDFNVLIIQDDPETNDLVTTMLGDYTLEVTRDGVSGLAKLISFKPDLVVLDFDLPVIDGFKVLGLIRSALNVPIIIISGSRMRALDRVMASELGADYYLTKPFSATELKHKARQLIARYRGISSWITTPLSKASSTSVSEVASGANESGDELFIPYTQFAAEVEKRVKAAMDNGTPFSIVGCRLPRMTANGGRLALRLFEIVGRLARDTDLTSTNQRNDLVVLLSDADTSGAQSFAGRLQERVIEELKEEPALWMRSFPDLEESTEAAAPVIEAAHGGAPNRRSGDMERSGRAELRP